MNITQQKPLDKRWSCACQLRKAGAFGGRAAIKAPAPSGSVFPGIIQIQVCSDLGLEWRCQLTWLPPHVGLRAPGHGSPEPPDQGLRVVRERQGVLEQPGPPREPAGEPGEAAGWAGQLCRQAASLPTTLAFPPEVSEAYRTIRNGHGSNMLCYEMKRRDMTLQ